MYKSTIVIIFITLAFPILAKSQTRNLSDFSQFIQKNYRFPEELKSNCEWMFAIVSVKTDHQNKIVSYDFINDPQKGIRNLKFILGYQFPPKMKINGHSIVFYLAIDNTETCIPKSSDHTYNPNNVVSQLLNTLDSIRRKDPKTIFINLPVYILLYPTIQKN